MSEQTPEQTSRADLLAWSKHLEKCNGSIAELFQRKCIAMYDLEDKCAERAAKIKALVAENSALVAKNAALVAKNAELSAQNSVLTAQNDVLTTQNNEFAIRVGEKQPSCVICHSSIFHTCCEKCLNPDCTDTSSGCCPSCPKKACQNSHSHACVNTCCSTTMCGNCSTKSVINTPGFVGKKCPSCRAINPENIPIGPGSDIANLVARSLQKQLSDALYDVRYEAALQLSKARADAASQLSDARAQAADQLSEALADAASQLSKARADAERDSYEAAQLLFETERKLYAMINRLKDTSTQNN